MKNMKIKFKLGAVFLIIMILSVLVGAISQLALTKVDAAATTFYTGPYKNKVICESMKTQVEATAKYAAYAMSSENLEDVKTYNSEMQEQLNSLYENVDYWVNLTGGSIEQINVVAEEATQVKMLANKFIELTNNMEQTEARDLYFNELYPYLMDIKVNITDFTAVIDTNASNAYTTIHSTYTTNSFLLTCFTVPTLFALIFGWVYLTRSLVRPITMIQDDVHRMADGDFSGELVSDSKDELGQLIESTSHMKESIKAIIDDTSRGLNEVANGNFNIAPEVEYVGIYKEIENSLGTIIVGLSKTMEQINLVSDSVLSGSDQVSSAAQELSQGSTEQAASVEELSATLQDINNQINETAKNANESMKMSQESGVKVDECNVQMNELVKAMQDINDKSTEISKIIKTIEDIAFQTNILALNAAVEAARAGTAGKGFAVVADEVRNLASKSADAASDTTKLIEETIAAVKHGASLVDATAASLTQVVEKSSVVNDKIKLIADATEIQADGMNQVTIGMEQINNVVQTNSATSEETAASSEELSSQAHTLKGLISKFNLLKM